MAAKKKWFKQFDRHTIGVLGIHGAHIARLLIVLHYLVRVLCADLLVGDNTVNNSMKC